jgi:4-oxalocrotonate tautomerase
MPVVQVSLKSGRSLEEKRELVERFTQALVEVCGSSAERVHVVINEVSEDNWGRGGRLLSDRPAVNTDINVE